MDTNKIARNVVMKVAGGIAKTFYCKNGLLQLVWKMDVSEYSGLGKREFDSFLDGDISDFEAFANALHKAFENSVYNKVEFYKTVILFDNAGHVYFHKGGNLHEAQDDNALMKICKSVGANYVNGKMSI